MLMAMFITEIGKMIKLTDLEFIIIQMVRDMKAGGLKINNMEMEKKFGQTMLVTKVSTKMVRNTVMVSSFGLMDQLIPEILSITIYMDKVFILGLMVVNTMVIGVQIKCMDQEFLHGMMVEDMKESTLMIKNKAMVFSLGLMVANMRANGRMENNMVLEHITLVKVKLRKVSGLMVKELHGLTNDDCFRCVKNTISFKKFLLNFFRNEDFC